MRLTRYLRTALLTKMGDNAVAAEVLNRLGERSGVTVSSRARTLRLLKAPRVILLHPKHFAYAIDVAKNFDLYFDALDCQEREGLRVVSYSEKPELLVLMRYCLERGMTFWLRDGRLLLRKGHRAMRIAVDRQIYAWAWEMAGHFERHFLPVIPTDEQGIMTVDYSKPGILQTYARSGLQFELASFPEEEDALDGYFRWYTPKSGDLVYDVGAHCGVSTYEFSQRVGESGRVVSFEPDPTSFALLQRNIERHGLTNVMALNVALAGTRGVAKFSAEGTLGSTLTRHLPRETVGSIVSVQTITLADAFESYGVPTFCKMDIEGAEVEVLAAGREAIKAHRIQFTLDTNHTVNGRLTDKPVEKIFRECGYRTETAKSDDLATTYAEPQ